MTKRQEIDDPNSCLNKGPDDELKFVIRAVDVVAPDTVRDWCRRRIEKGKNLPSDQQIQDALRWADRVEQALIGRLEIGIRRVEGKTAAETIGELRARIAELEGGAA